MLGDNNGVLKSLIKKGYRNVDIKIEKNYWVVTLHKKKEQRVFKSQKISNAILKLVDFLLQEETSQDLTDTQLANAYRRGWEDGLDNIGLPYLDRTPYD